MKEEKTRRSNWKPRTVAAIIVTAVIGFGCLIAVFIGMFNAEATAQWLNSWPKSINFLKWILGILFALLFVVSTFASIMLTYLSLRQIYAKAKFRVELLVFVPTLLLSIVVKVMVLYLGSGPDFESELFSNVTGTILKSIYMAIGGLSFEGLPETPGLIELQLIPFYGTSIVTALVFIGVIGSTFAYEAYSYILIKVLYGFFPGKLHYDTFVFTALNDETLCLACSVAHDKPDAIIIFAGPALEPFDRHNELCAEVMGNGFLYWSYYEDPKKTIVASLGLKRKYMNQEENSFYVFAFDTDENGLPEEEKNADAIFDDASLRKAHPDKFFIRYVLLGRGENDFQAYQVKKARSLDPKLADLSLWTEAKSIAEQVASYLKCEDVLGACVPNPEGTRVRSIGFGETARAIVKELYIQSTMARYEDDKIVEAPFYADIFDARSLEIAGFFKKETPYARCYKEGQNPPVDKVELNCPLFHFHEKNYTHIDIVTGEADELVKQKEKDFDYVVIATGDDRENINIANSIISERYNDDNHKKLIVFVTVYNKRNNIFMTAPQEMHDAFLINDRKEKNRAKAQKAIDCFKGEVEHTKKVMRFSTLDEAAIFRKNVYRYNDKLIAVIVGNREDTFLYPAIRYQKRSAKFHIRYELVADHIYQASDDKGDYPEVWKKSLSDLRKYYKGGGFPEFEEDDANAKVVKILDKLYLQSDESDEKTIDTKWSEISLWDRQSNIEVYHYARTYYKILVDNYPEIFSAAKEQLANIPAGLDQFKILALLTYIEHARWNRAHIAAGWRSGTTDKLHRIHSCLVPMANLEESKSYSWAYAYDLSNVMLSISTYQKIEKGDE